MSDESSERTTDCDTAADEPGLAALRPSRARPEALDSRKLSCAEMALANAQGLIVNQRVSPEAADYLARLFAHRNLRRFASYFDLSSGSVKNHYITPDEIGGFTALGKTVDDK